MTNIVNFLMFEGKAEEAMNFYVDLLEDSEVTSMMKYGPESPDVQGQIVHARFELGGKEFGCMDSHTKHAFGFTPANSIYIESDSEEEIDRLWKALSEGGSVLMEMKEYPFSKKYGWTNDRFGVSWQLFLLSDKPINIV